MKRRILKQRIDRIRQHYHVVDKVCKNPMNPEELKKDWEDIKKSMSKPLIKIYGKDETVEGLQNRLEKETVKSLEKEREGLRKELKEKELLPSKPPVYIPSESLDKQKFDIMAKIKSIEKEEKHIEHEEKERNKLIRKLEKGSVK